MKVIYVPITVPWNARSIIAMVMTLVCVIICFATAWSADWYHGLYTLSTSNPNDVNTVRTEIGPWELKMTLCGISAAIGKEVCHDKYSVFQECRRSEGQSIDLTRFGFGSEESQFRSFTWCSGWKLVVAAWALLLLAAIVGIINLVASLIREHCHGPFALISFVFLMLALILFASGVTRFMDEEVHTLENFMASGGHTVEKSLRPGVALGFAAFACVLWAAATTLSMSLFCCPPKRGRQRAPRIFVVSTDRSALGGPIPVPPQPGFEALGPSQSQNRVDYDEDGPEMEERRGREEGGSPGIPPRAPRGVSSPGSATTKPVTNFSTTARDRRYSDSGADIVLLMIRG